MAFKVKHYLTEKPGVFAPRGAARELWRTYDFERVLSGPADTGKTFGLSHYVNALCWRFPKCQGVIARKTLTSVFPTVLHTYMRVIGVDGGQSVSPNGIKVFGGSKPEWFDYPNGSRLWVAGLDKAGKALSSERDFIYVNQLEECSLDDWETLTTRASGRGAVMPRTYMLGDCNPQGPTHWILSRRSLRLMETRHEDNPDIYTRDGRITPKGKRRIAVLDNLTGVRFWRLRKGKWVAAEGVVYPDWATSGPGANVIDEMPTGWRSWRRIRAVDFGYTNPFCCQWWAIDPDGRMYCYREMYVTGRIVEDLADGVKDPDDRGRLLALGINQWSDGETYDRTVCDHDAEDRATLERHGIDTTPAYKNIADGINAVAERIRPAGDGRRRLYYLRGACVDLDETLIDERKPTSTLQEFDSYVWPKGKNGKSPDEVPVDANNHGMDTMRYAVASEDLARLETGPSDDPEYYH